ncbi:TorF family putative porin [Sphingomonas sp. UNC305MFCol5.2]|uniref:TorF family putative porin n=1 Tax=Sphingomonas sp. UNC305MFCol5.2 TaxID=1449076 RepID=UPI0004A6E161|nr:TorF family putative porin [Sphingomonas sp. UNC305MFCol5.2]
MRFSMISLGALALVTAAPAMAQDETEPAPAVTVNGSATVVSDYKFRGISQTDGNFAVQGGITVSHESGFYVSVWGSSVDDYVTVHGTAHQEIDLIAGFKKSFDGVTFDIGALYYVYPGTRPGFAGDNSASDFIEPYVSLSYAIGPVTAKATANYAPKQKALALDQGATGLLDKQDNLYLAGDLSTSIPNTPLALTAHLGHTFGPSWLSGPTDEYTDWALGATATWKSLTFGVQYVDTDTFFTTPSGKNAAKGGVIGTIGVSF